MDRAIWLHHLASSFCIHAMVNNKTLRQLEFFKNKAHTNLLNLVKQNDHR